MRRSLIRQLLSLSLLGFSLITPQPALANSSDWLQVERFKEVLEEAEKGKLQAMYEVGLKYQRGRGTERNIPKAAEWYGKAAEANHALSMARLGILYVEGNGVERNLNKAIELLSKAADQDIASARYQLANMHELGTGFDKDLEQAIRLYRQAANGGYYPAQDKVEELSALLKQKKRRNAAVSTPQPQPQPQSQPETTVAILKGNWQRSGRYAAYLPSNISRCREQDDIIKCISTPQERSTGAQIITYNTEATLSNFNEKQFHISYVNNVLEVEQQENTRIDVYGEGEARTPTNSGIQPGQKSSPHQLECTLESRDTVSCVKDQYRQVSFTSQ
ncbi:tetratricopeptide repeat protein [Thiohalophilus thiocyanatoxydans]|uniref:Sel1 repeat-containing protein n=1 Tax=Thiohalophilus thiocyanatoxydans TaxID=381308 RepID=A0A4R8IIK3_9GAMM|nr:tetratricopeptide repeat protein [Thiohalophilus thiocyanatoxydans]TDY00481.1 Sel1 repeat-containing protein [Thiohalophilus thiocyanatoxydans]